MFTLLFQEMNSCIHQIYTKRVEGKRRLFIQKCHWEALLGKKGINYALHSINYPVRTGLFCFFSLLPLNLPSKHQKCWKKQLSHVFRWSQKQKFGENVLKNVTKTSSCRETKLFEKISANYMTQHTFFDKEDIPQKIPVIKGLIFFVFCGWDTLDLQ